MTGDIETLNADWLKAWTDKDVPRLLSFYSPDAVYKDPQVPDGLTGQEALGAYLTQLFGATPPMTYNPETVWSIEGGFCGRWFCDIGSDGDAGRIRGFDLVLLDDEGRIRYNEVYVHQLAGAA